MATDKQPNAVVIPDNWDSMSAEEQDRWVEEALIALFRED